MDSIPASSPTPQRRALPSPSRIIRLDLLPKQQGFCASADPELLYSGAWGAGKTRALCVKALFLAQRYPGSLIGVCRKTLKSLRSTTLRTFFKEVCPPEHIVNFNKTDGLLTVKAGPRGDQESQLLFFGLTTEKGDSYNIRSLNLGACGVDETIELTEDEWDEIGGRLRDPHCAVHQLFGATNPGSKGHWLYRRFFLKPEPGVHRVIETNSLENPYLPADYVARIRRLTGRYFDRYVMGKWVDFAGLVYDVFDPLVHLITWEQFAERFGRPAIPAEWKRVAGIDFGYANPFVHQWWALSPDAEWFRYREIYYTRRIVSEHARQIKALEGRDGVNFPEPVWRRFADHDAEDRATLHSCGLDTEAAKKEISPGIQTVYELLKPDEKTGRPRMFFLRDALVEEDPYLVNEGLPTCTEDELQAYRYPKGTDAKNPKEAPVDLNNHGADATRYAAHSYRHGASGAFEGWLDKRIGGGR